jgi:hypothetical protein
MLVVDDCHNTIPKGRPTISKQLSTLDFTGQSIYVGLVLGQRKCHDLIVQRECHPMETTVTFSLNYSTRAEKGLTTDAYLVVA